MKTFKIERADYYLVTFEAENEKEALKLLKEDDNLLNNGSFMESVFNKKTLEEE